MTALATSPVRARRALLLAGIMLLAAALRLPGLAWGLPDALHPAWSWHPDELLPLRWARWLAQGNIIDKHFSYGGTLHFRMLNAYYDGGALLAPLLGDNLLRNTLLVGRGFVVLASLLTVLLCYLAGRRLFGYAGGLLAAALLAIMPVHAFLAQNVRPDEVSTLLVMLMVYLSTFILQGDGRHDRRIFFAAGLLAGITMALRVPLAVFAITPVLAYGLRESRAHPNPVLARLLRSLGPLLAGGTALGYLAGSPQTFLYLPAFLDGLQTQRQYQATAFPDAIGRGPALLQYGWSTLREAVGVPLYGFMLAGVLAAFIRPRPGALLVAVPALCYFCLLLPISWVVVRYTMPMAPLLALSCAALLGTKGPLRQPYRLVALGLLAVAAVWTLAGDLAFLRVQIGPNTRELARDWIAGHAAAGATVIELQGYRGDVYFNPDVPGYHIRYVVLDDSFEPSKPMAVDRRDYLVLNEELYGNMERLAPGTLSPQIDVLRQILHDHYSLQAEIRPQLRLLGFDFSSWYRSQDYRIIAPGERIYRFQPGAG